MIEVVGSDTSDIFTVQQTHSPKQQSINVALMNQILDTFDPKSYANVEVKPKCEHVM